jgi:hypothetical protein
MFKPIVGIIGNSGTGKSSSYADLPPEKTYILDVERKGMPFNTKPWAGRIIPVRNSMEMFVKVAECLKKPDCEYLVTDSISKFFDLLETEATQNFKNYDIWNYYNKKVTELLNLYRSEVTTNIIIGLDEILRLETAEGGFETKRRLKVQGKRHEGSIEKELLMVLFTVAKTKGDETIYSFQTNTDGITSAKSPAWLNLPKLMPNKLGALFELCNKKWQEDV